ncbi:hypothetical protein N665_0059s0019 [Sinapis alba]|nr:hypothetical protein N665_0059s0019 [Sinapis alba]
MTNSNLASLPPSMLHKILSKVATSQRTFSFGSTRVAFYGFNQVVREEYFYRSADLFHLNDWMDEVNAVRTFKLRCYQFGNPEAIYMRGMYEFFILHLLDERRGKSILHVREDCCWSSHWAYEKPEMFMSLLERIDSNVSHAWDFCNEIYLTVAHWPIED